MKIEIQDKWFSENECLSNLNKLYVFGDNLLRTGKKGQAQIRDCENSIGIATKFKPSMRNDSFFSDDRDELFSLIEQEVKVVVEKAKAYEVIVFPADGIGTGLAQLPIKAPKLFKFLNSLLEKYFNIIFVDGKFRLKDGG